MFARTTHRHTGTILQRSLHRHLLTFRQSSTEPKAWSVPATRLHARKQVRRVGK